jgi:uncharacterized protein (TIGR02757 family)
MTLSELKEFLDEKAALYNRPEFIETDPIRIPHSFSKKENIEISGFLTATIAWGNRVSIIKSAGKLMKILDNQPYDYIINASPDELIRASKFYYRTFGSNDTLYFLKSISNIYLNHGGLEQVFSDGYLQDNSIKSALHHFHKVFFEIAGEGRTRKHVPDVMKGSAAKRLNLFLRWMVRNDNEGVDFGLWKQIPASGLMLPLDLHTSKTAHQLGILQRKQNDWKAVEEVTSVLRTLNPSDPVRYDYALFGLSAFEKSF